MSVPFKRICLRASTQRLSKPSTPRQWHQLRAISNTRARGAEQSQEPDPTLDTLANQPGIRTSMVEDPEDLKKVGADNISSLAHRELEQHKELREMVRIAAWEMPLLTQLAKPFEPPGEDQVLRWRYTTYMGETHPASRKVVVEFQPDRLKDLSTEQRKKLLVVAGTRYNPSTKTIKMSCESFETQAQNKRYLADTINKLIAEAKDPEGDSFADIPLDTRHHKPRKQLKFPEAWVLTPGRKAELEQKRRAKLLAEGQRVEENRLVDGIAAIEAAEKVNLARLEEPVMANARQRLPSGKMGQKQMGQLPVNR